MRMLKGTLTSRWLAVALVVALLGAALLTLRDGGAGEKTVTAHFPRAVSVYVGTDVRILGVNVGKVTAVTPEGASVRVDMTYDAQYDVPADAKAVVVTPTLVADRFVQLTPVFTGGEVMASGADIPLPKTAVPVELDRIYATLRDLAVTLGPNGLNEDGTLNHLVEAGANAFDGQGARTNEMINELSKAAATFGAGSGDLFETVTQLAQFTGTLADNDALVRGFIRDLAGVSDQLSGERFELQGVLREVAGAVGTVEGFVRDNRQALVGNLDRLSRVVANLNSEKESIDRSLEVGALGIGNLKLSADQRTQSIGSRVGFGNNVWDADGLLCAIVQQSQLPATSKQLACALFKALIEPVVKDLPVPTGPGLEYGGGQPGGQPGNPARQPSALPDPPAGAPTLAQLLGGGR